MSYQNFTMYLAAIPDFSIDTDGKNETEEDDEDVEVVPTQDLKTFLNED